MLGFIAIAGLMILNIGFILYSYHLSSKLNTSNYKVGVLSEALESTRIDNIKLTNDLVNLQSDIEEITVRGKDLYDELNEKYHRELSARKSSEVRVGHIAEQMVPFMESWPWESKDFRFIGSPIDGLQITYDKIFLVEIKTGKSRLSKKQENIKKLVKEGKVEFVTVRIDEQGVRVI